MLVRHVRWLLAAAMIAASILVTATPASAGHSCTVNAGIQRLSNTTYDIGGYGSCNQSVASLTLSCKPIHKHTAWWHSHSGTTFPASSGTSSIGWWWWGPLGGTDGDTYKTSCTGYFTDHGSQVTDTDESYQVTL